MRIALASASLRRHGPRTLLAVLGVAISAALLLDMVMLSTGMRESFRSLLTRQQVRERGLRHLRRRREGPHVRRGVERRRCEPGEVLG